MFDPKGEIPFVHFSHRLDTLIEQLKGELYPAGSRPFEKRMIVIPHLGMKNTLLHALAEDKTHPVAAGLEIVGVGQAYAKLTRKPLPGLLELSLFLQHAISKMWHEEEVLSRYFEGKEERIPPFADRLAQIFSKYVLFGKQALPPWQQSLWKEVEKRWTFPSKVSRIDSRWQVHVFGFAFLPRVYQELFAKAGATFYLYSPCEIFWGDFYSEKEQTHFEPDLFADQNLFLSNWGKVGRKMAEMIDGANFPTEEHYPRREGNHTLRQIQDDLLQGTLSTYEADESIEGFRAPTPLRELQVLKDHLLHLFDQKGITPRDVQVFAPDINLYAPFLEGVFSSEIAYGVSNLSRMLFDPIAKGVAHLLELVKGRFAKKDLLHLLSLPPFLQKAGFTAEDVKIFEKWSSLAHIQWGFSKEHRKILLEEESRAGGTWERGLDRLLLGLGQMGGEGAPLCVIDVTEMELFSKFYTLLHSLYDDLSPFFDGTKWTLSTWLRYFATLIETYFSIEPGNDLYGECLQLASSCDDLDSLVSYSGVEPIINQLLSKKGGATHPPHLQAVRFSSLSEGCALPSKIICLIGMGEGAFPRLESPISFAADEVDYRPTMAETDRYLFLQLLSAAQEKVLISYVSGEEERGSPLVEELFAAIKHSELPLHPQHPFDPVHFSGYSQEDYAAATQKLAPREPLIPSFYNGRKWKSEGEAPKQIEIQKLIKFARHPLRFYLEERLGIYPSRYATEEEEYLLSPLRKMLLAREALTRSLDEVWEEAKGRGELPENLFTPLAKEQISREVALWTDALEVFGIASEELGSFSLKKPHSITLASGQTVELIGKLDLVTPKGVLVNGEEKLEDRVRFAPHAALARHFDLGPLLSVKGKEPLEFEMDLPEYLDYFLRAWENPSPLTPTLVRPLIEGGEAEVVKALRTSPDDPWSFLLMRDPLPDGRALLAHWSEPLRQLFGGVDATV